VADHSIAGRSGYDLCQSIKSDPALRGVPVYILASIQSPIDEGRLRQCGGDGHFSKPFDTTAILDRVRDAIAKGGTTTTFAQASVPVPEETFDADSATLRVSPDGMDDYGEIAIVPSSSGVDATPPPENVVTPPPRLRSADVPPPVAARAVATEANAPIVSRATASPGAPAALPVVSQRATPSVAPSGTPSGGPAAGMRPSLIPGLRPGALPAAVPAPRASVPTGPGQSPTAARSVVGSAARSSVPVASPPTTRAPAPATPSVTPAAARTLMGLPAVMAQSPARSTAAPARPGAAGANQSAMPGVTAPRVASTSAASIMAAATSKVDQKMAAIAARGPEYEAIAKLSREIIEKVVWEVVPELAEVIVREELAKRGRI